MGEDSTGRSGSGKSGGPKEDRRLREAAALRENLRKRKLQQRARSDPAGPSADPAETGRKDPETK